MKKFVSALLILMLCVSFCTSALGEDQGEAHSHWLWADIYNITYNEHTHTIKAVCTYDDFLLGYCGKSLEKTEEHKFIPVKMSNDGKKVSLKCSECNYLKDVNVTTKNWMLTIPNNALISQINLPGAFHSAAYYTDNDEPCSVQTRTLSEQLNDGVRILHWELEANNSNWQNYNVTFQGEHVYNEPPVYFWQSRDEMYFRHAAEYINNFLNANPSETVVLILQRSKTTSAMDNNMKNYLLYGLSRYSFERTENSFWDRFVAYRPDDPIPKLGDVRGKCIVLYYDENPLTYYADMDGRTKAGWLEREADVGYRGFFDKDYVEGLMDIAMQPYFNGLQDYTLTSDTFHKENYRYLTNPGEPSVKLVTYDGYMGQENNSQYVILGGVDGAYYDDSLHFTYEVLQPAIKRINYTENRGHRIGWVLSRYENQALCQAIINSNARVGDYVKPLQKDTSEEPIDHSYPLTDWMSYLPDNALISQLNLPGTHDSGTTFMYNSITATGGRCQSKTIKEQLEAGCRTLDIRVGKIDSPKGKTWEYMNINHNGYNCYVDSDHTRWLLIKDVLDDVQNFLKTHKTETVVMLVNEDEDTDNTNKHIKEMKTALDNDRKDRINDSWPCADFYSVGEKIPTLAEARGKCIILWDDEMEIGPSEKNEAPRADYSDKYKLPVHEKTGWITMAMNNAYLMEMQNYNKRGDVFSNNGALKCPYRPGDPVVRYVGYNANTMEYYEDPRPMHGPEWHFDHLEEFLKSIKPRTGKRVGWVAMDFPKEVMIRNIINSNFPITTVGRVNLILSDELMTAISSPGNEDKLSTLLHSAFARATLCTWDAGAFTDFEVDTLGTDAWQKNEETGGYTFYFRVYKKVDADGHLDYYLKFPNASGTKYTVTQKLNERRYELEKVNNLFVHAIEWDIVVNDLESPLVPQTGDASRPDLWGAMMVLALVGMIALTVRRRMATNSGEKA